MTGVPAAIMVVETTVPVSAAILRQESVMRSRLVPGLLALSVFFLMNAGAAEEEGPSLDDLVREFAVRLPPETITSVQVFDTNGFRIESHRHKELDAQFEPNGKEIAMVSVSAPGTFRLAVSRGVKSTQENEVNIFLGDSGSSLLTLVDSNGDGRPDMLSYYAVDNSGNHTAQLFDYDMNGQPDYKIDFVEHRVEIWHAGHWYTVETRDGKRGIALDGNFVELQQKNDGFPRHFVP